MSLSAGNNDHPHNSPMTPLFDNDNNIMVTLDSKQYGQDKYYHIKNGKKHRTKQSNNQRNNF